MIILDEVCRVLALVIVVVWACVEAFGAFREALFYD